jgi:hypothetical protein
MKPQLVRRVEVSWTEMHSRIVEIPVEDADDDMFIDHAEDFLEHTDSMIHMVVHEKEVLDD